MPRSIPFKTIARFALVAALLSLGSTAFYSGGFAGSAGRSVSVNGEALEAEDRRELETLIGPLKGGEYWVNRNGDFGRAGSGKPIANLRLLLQRKASSGHARKPRQASREATGQREMAALRMQQFLIQRELIRRQLMARALQEAMRRQMARQNAAPGAYSYGNGFSSGLRYGNGSWSHYNGYSNYGVGGTGNGCIYTSNWSNC